jgi:hypothetical protein
MLGFIVPEFHPPQALPSHLSYLTTPVLQKLGTFGPLRCQEAWALERLLREARVLEAVCELSRLWEIPATSAQEGKGLLCSGIGVCLKLLPYSTPYTHLSVLSALLLTVSLTPS